MKSTPIMSTLRDLNHNSNPYTNLPDIPESTTLYTTSETTPESTPSPANTRATQATIATAPLETPEQIRNTEQIFSREIDTEFMQLVEQFLHKTKNYLAEFKKEELEKKTAKTITTIEKNRDQFLTELDSIRDQFLDLMKRHPLFNIETATKTLAQLKELLQLEETLAETTKKMEQIKKRFLAIEEEKYKDVKITYASPTFLTNLSKAVQEYQNKIKELEARKKLEKGLNQSPGKLAKSFEYLRLAIQKTNKLKDNNTAQDELANELKKQENKVGVIKNKF